MIAAEIKLPMANKWQDYSKIESWCIDMFGPEAQERDQVSDEYPWTSRYYNNTGARDDGYMWWYFAREEYAVQFALRWL